MNLFQFLTWLEESALGLNIAESLWLFPTIETIHVLALCLVFGSIAMVDLRLLGVSRRDIGVMQLSQEVLPWTWGAFVVAAITGTLMFVSSATRYADNIPFLIKIVLLILAAVNMAIFNATANRAVHNWNFTLPTPIGARVAASLSLLFWTATIIAGRWIGFV